MRRLVVFIIIGLVVIGGIWWLVNLLTTGHITITTGDPNNVITLTQVIDEDKAQSGDKPLTKQAKGSLSLTLPTGKYVASVQGNSVATTQTIILKPAQHLSFALNPKNASGIEPVAYVAGYALAANDSRLLYLDDRDNSLRQINAQNTISSVAPNVVFKSIRWADASYGVGQDTKGQMYIIKDGSVQALKNPLGANTSSITQYAIAPDHHLFLAIGGDIYGGAPGGDFAKLYSENRSFSSLVASNNGVTIINSPVDGITSSGSSFVDVVDNTGKALKKNIGIAAETTWSPDSQHMATADGDSGLEVFDDSLNEIAAIPGTTMNDVVWIDNQTLAYSLNDTLWTYSLASGRANLVANAPLAAPITELAVSSDKAYIYAVTGNSGTYSVRRVGLRSQKVPAVVYKLQNILPINIDAYSISLVNFTHPTIIVQPTPSSPPSFLQDARTDLQGRGFDLSQLGFQQGVSSNE
jgi:hypothetical protein